MRTELRLPFPPTVNNLFSGTTRRFTSPRYAAWQREASEKDERLKRVAGTQTVPVVFEMTAGLQLVPVGLFADRVMEHVAGFDTAQGLDFWREQNTMALKQFWAHAPGDALELKKRLEGKREELTKQHTTAAVA